MLMDKTTVFLDGGYISKISKEIGNGIYLEYDIKQFGNTLAKEQGLWCTDVYYYTAPPFQAVPPTPEEAKKRAGYDKWLTKVKKIPGLIIREGRLQKINGIYRQKGVDTLLTMDMVFLRAKSPQIKKIILVACDTDFVPILNELRKTSIEVILYYYTDRIRNSIFSMSNHILTATDKKYLIKKEHFEKSFRQKSIQYESLT